MKAKLLSTYFQKHSDFYINLVMSYGYTKKEAINILNGKHSDGTDFVELPF